MNENLVLRIKTAAVLVPAVALILWVGGMALTIAAVIVSCLLLYEFYAFSLRQPRYRTLQFTAASLIVPLSVGVYGPTVMLPVSVVSLIAISILLLQSIEADAHQSPLLPFVAAPFFGFGYLGVLCAVFILATRSELATQTLLFIIVVVMCTDTFAYFTGRKFGKQKLAPRISPGKTVAGAIGGTLFGMFAALTCWSIAGIPDDWVTAVSIGCLVSILSQVGDLIASLIKRIYEVKDSGTLLPGHGGLLDRLDGLLFAMIVTLFQM